MPYRFRNLAFAACAAFVLSLAAPVAFAQTTLRVVKHSDLKIVDPIWTTAYITRDHGYMVYDTMFAIDASGQVKPQMIDKYDLSPDKLTWTMTLRDGLLWHDGTPVTAEDCVESIKRYDQTDPADNPVARLLDVPLQGMATTGDGDAGA